MPVFSYATNSLTPTDAAIPGSGFAPSDHGFMAWNYDVTGQTTFNIALTAGQTYLALLPIRQTCTITNVIVGILAGAGLTAGQNFAGLYDVNGNLLSATADQATNWTTTAVKTMALTTPQSAKPGLYYVALLANGTTRPSPFYNAGLNGTGNGGILNPSTPRLAIDTTHTGLTALRSTVTLTAASSPLFWAAVS